jgi:SAM-dependent methyltransferase
MQGSKPAELINSFMDRQNQTRIDDLYKNTPLEEIPWNMETPPELLVELVDSGKVHPCKAVDLGCGAGNHAIYLAGRGFEVTGIDFSPTAIRIAKENAEKKGVKCNFFVADVIDGLDKINQTWDFAYDWGLLHHISPKRRRKYLENVRRILNPKGKFLSVSFSEKDTSFEGSAKYRKTSLGTTLYFSSEDELRKLFEMYFVIIVLRTVEISGKFQPHIFNYVFAEKMK